jgi:hypothetical protein
VTDQEKAKGGAQAEEYEPLLRVVLLGILKYERLLVEEGGLGLLKRDAVFLLIRTRLLRTPMRSAAQPCTTV